jgi:hypothetical protein
MGDAIAGALCVPVPFVLRFVTRRQHAALLLEVRASARRSLPALSPCASMAVRPQRAPVVASGARLDARCAPRPRQVAAGGQELQRLVDHYAATARQSDALRAAWAHVLSCVQTQPLLCAVRARCRHCHCVAAPLRRARAPRRAADFK